MKSATISKTKIIDKITTEHVTVTETHMNFFCQNLEIVKPQRNNKSMQSMC